MDINNILDYFLEDKCHLLSFHLNKKITGSKLYLLVDKKGNTIHSLVYYENKFYDFYNKWSNLNDIIENLHILFGFKKNNMFLSSIKNINQLNLEIYNKNDHKNIKIFIENIYMPNFFSKL